MCQITRAWLRSPRFLVVEEGGGKGSRGAIKKRKKKEKHETSSGRPILAVMAAQLHKFIANYLVNNQSMKSGGRCWGFHTTSVHAE